MINKIDYCFILTAINWWYNVIYDTQQQQGAMTDIVSSKETSRARWQTTMRWNSFSPVDWMTIAAVMMEMEDIAVYNLTFRPFCPHNFNRTIHSLTSLPIPTHPFSYKYRYRLFTVIVSILVFWSGNETNQPPILYLFARYMEIHFTSIRSSAAYYVYKYMYVNLENTLRYLQFASQLVRVWLEKQATMV